MTSAAAQVMPPRSLPRLQSVTAAPIADRGKLLNAKQAAELVFNGHKGWRWILDNAPESLRVRAGQKVLFYEHDMRAWLDAGCPISWGAR